MEKSRLKQFYLLFIAILLIILAVNVTPQIKKEVEYKRYLADIKTEVKKLYIEEGIPKRGLDADELDVLTQRALELDGEEGHILVEELELVEQVNLADKLWLEINKEGTLPDEHNIDIYRFKDSVEELPEANQAQFAYEIKAFEDREERLEKLFEEKKQQYAHEFEVVENEWLGNLNQEGPEPYEAMLKDLIQNNESRVFDDVIEDADYLIDEFRENNQKMLLSITENAHKTKTSNQIVNFDYYFKREETKSGQVTYVLYASNQFDTNYKIATDFYMLEKKSKDGFWLHNQTNSDKIPELRKLSSYTDQTQNGKEISFIILKANSDTRLCEFDEDNYNNGAKLMYRPYKGVSFSYDITYREE